jgi:alkylhydroperoxidase family enzyme
MRPPVAVILAILPAYIDLKGTGRSVAGIYRTYAHHIAMDAPRTRVSEHIRQTSTLSARVRELLIMRIGWLCRSEYEWAAHAPAGRRAGMTEQTFGASLRGLTPEAIPRT